MSLSLDTNLLKRPRSFFQSRVASLEISDRNSLWGSLGPTSDQRSLPTIQVEANKNPNIPPPKASHRRGGQLFLSGTRAASSTFTLGVSFASCTFAISYDSVKSSKTVSSTFARRYKSRYCRPKTGNCRMDG